MIQSGQNSASPHSYLDHNQNRPENNPPDTFMKTNHWADALAVTLKNRTNGMKLGLGALVLDRSRTWCATREDYAFAGQCRSALAPTERAARRRDLMPPNHNRKPKFRA